MSSTDTALEQVRAAGCDFPNPSVYYMAYSDTFSCRCMVCGRCGKHTGNSHQGHNWKFCSAKGEMAADWHFCCPDDCELEGK